MFSNFSQYLPKNSIYIISVSILLSLFIAFFEVLSISLLPYFFSAPIDSKSEGDFLLFILEETFNISNNTLLINFILFVSIFLTKNLLVIGLKLLVNLMMLRFSANFERNIFNHIVKNNEKIKEESSVQVFNIEIHNARTFFLIPALNGAIELIISIALVIYFLSISPFAISLAMIFLICTIAISVHYVSELSNYLGNRRVTLQESLLYPVLKVIDTLSKNLNIKSKSKVQESYWQISKKLNDIRAYASTLTATSSNIVEIIILLFLPFGFYILNLDGNFADITFLATYGLIFYRLYPSLSRMTNYVNRMKQGQSSIKFINKYLGGFKRKIQK